VRGKTIEELTQGEVTADASTTLTAAGITPVTESLDLDINALLLSLDPKAGFFDHDKVEGVAVLNGGKQIVISSDSDFGISGLAASTSTASTSTATVTIHVISG
jgi:hypothetical protein